MEKLKYLLILCLVCGLLALGVRVAGFGALPMTDSILPQTGINKLPMQILLVAGVVLVIVGIVLVFRKKGDDRHE